VCRGARRADLQSVPPIDPAIGSDAAVDPDRLCGLQETYGDLAAQLVGLFEQTAADTLRELRDAVAVGDDEATRRLAHRLKGGCRNVGATGLAELTVAIEQGAVDPRAGVERLGRAVAPACAALHAAIA
jgi:HPt (histidine-containing phosphotransfer) domain-containing protein